MHQNKFNYLTSSMKIHGVLLLINVKTPINLSCAMKATVIYHLLDLAPVMSVPLYIFLD